MALVVDTNSYINLTDANLYFADRLNCDVWDNASDTNKEKALIQATKFIDSYSFVGTKYAETQTLKFPRSYPLDFIIDGFAPVSGVTPQNIKDAVCELAIWLLQDDYTAANDLSEFNSATVGALSVTMANTGSNAFGMKTLPPLVISLLSPYQSSGVLVRG